MSVANETPTFTYACSAGQTQYQIPFTYDDQSYVKLIWVDTSVTPNVEHLLTYGADYTVSVKDAATRYATLSVAKANGQLVVFRETSIQRDTDYQTYSPLAVQNLNTELDRMFRILQEQINGGRSILIPGTSTTIEGQTSDALLPTVGAVWRHLLNASGGNTINAVSLWDSINSAFRTIGAGTNGIPVNNGVENPSLNAGLFGGNLPSYYLNAANLTGVIAAISGANLTNLNASALASGTVPLSRIPATLTGKDADTVDGSHAGNLMKAIEQTSSTLDWNTVTTPGVNRVQDITNHTNKPTGASSWGNILVLRGASSAQVPSDVIDQIYFCPDATNRIFQRHYFASTWTAWAEIWTSASDGTGSGMDADLLDGQEGSYYRNASNLNAGTVPNAQFPATLPAASGVNLTALNATQLTNGTIPNARISALPMANLAVDPTNAGNLSSGTIPAARFPLGVNPAPIPISSGGNTGDYSGYGPAQNAAFVLPAGGTYLYFGFRIYSNIDGGGVYNSNNASFFGSTYGVIGGIASGGTTVGSAITNTRWAGFYWRIG
jgi:hypothetical protein